MDLFGNISVNLLSPMILAFALGLVATLIKSDLKIPEEMYMALTIFLLLAIGIKGGAKLAQSHFSEFWKPVTVALVLGALIPFWCYAILRKLGKFDTPNAAGIAAHYGSVSAVTFGEVLAFLDFTKISYEIYVPALLAIMEVPGIVSALMIAKLKMRGQAGGAERTSIGKVLREIFAGKSFLLLAGGIAIGLISGKRGFEQVAPFFDVPFRGVLTLFLLEVGMVTGRRLYDLKSTGPFLLGFGILMPIANGMLGVLLGDFAGLSLGGCTVLGTLAASASYIAAPAAVRMALPEASPTYYLTSALAITFPFNVLLGIPLYFSFAQWLLGGTAA
ncbi:MAG: sodium-dependent bicarbonate transport family permease [bacterium]